MLSALSLLLGLTTSSYALNCQEFEAAQSDDGSGLFEVTNENPKLDSKLRDTLIRKSVSAYYGANYYPDMNLEEIEELAEGVGVSEVKDLQGKKYIEVSVGFGGGNNISYYYLPKSIQLAPIAVVDGLDCLEQGSTREFPLDREPEDSKLVTITCEATNKTSPISSLQLQLPVSGTTITDTETVLETSLNLKHRAYESYSEAETRTVTTVSARVTASGLRLGMHLAKDVEIGKKEWSVEHSIVVIGTEGKIKTLLHPKETGGRWKEPKEETTLLKCSVPNVSDIVYERKIIY